MFTVYVCWMYLSNPIYLLHYVSMYFSFGAFFVHRRYNGRIPYINAMVPQSLFSFNPDLTQAFSMQAQHRIEILRTSCRIHGLHRGALNPTWVWGDLGLGYAGWWCFIPGHTFWTLLAQSGSIWSRDWYSQTTRTVQLRSQLVEHAWTVSRIPYQLWTNIMMCCMRGMPTVIYSDTMEIHRCESLSLFASH